MDNFLVHIILSLVQFLISLTNVTILAINSP